MNYNLLYFTTNILCESATYLVPYINSTDLSCSIYSGSVTNITVENYFDLMQMLSYYDLDYSFVGNIKAEEKTSIILRNGNLILPSDSYVTPSYVFCDILLSKDDVCDVFLSKEFKEVGSKDVSEKSDVSEREMKEALDSFTKDLMKKVLCIAKNNVDTEILVKVTDTSISDNLKTENTQETTQENK